MNLTSLLALIDEYHITDRRLARARERAARVPSPQTERELRREARRYFSALAREAKADLADVDRRLDDLYQRQYNLHAERAVLVRRLEGAVRVTAVLDETGE